MSQQNPTIDSAREPCEQCGEETDHTVAVKLVTESDRDRNTEFSREPYRISTCDVCETEQMTRMNDA